MKWTDYPFEQGLKVAKTDELEQELAKLNRERARLEALNPDLQGRDHLRKVGELRATALDRTYHGLVWQPEAIEAELARRRALGQDVIRLDHERGTVTTAGGTLRLGRRRAAFKTIELLAERRRSGFDEIKKAVGLPKTSELRHSLRGLAGPGKLIIAGEVVGTLCLNGDLLKPLPAPGPDKPRTARTRRRREEP